MQRSKGFSLIELLIVVAIILIIAAIAIPNLLRARIAANEASAVGSLRTINTGEVTYASTYPSSGYASTLSALSDGGSNACPATPSSTSACLIDTVLGCGTMPCVKSGYKFSVSTAAAINGIIPYYQSGADPVSVGQTGQRHFFSDSSGVIRYNASAVASSSDTPLQ
jgi:prepilin-type N-terminal cleavage/methylation domain-containing protein